MKYMREKYYLLLALRNARLYDMLRKNNTIIAGGAIRSVFTKESINDYDLYFKTYQDYKEVYNYLIEAEDCRKVYETEVAVSFQTKHGLKIQLIKSKDLMFEETRDLIEEFDFTICMGAYELRTDTFVFHEDFLRDNAGKELKINLNTFFPISTMMRILKYQKYGYSVSHAEVFKLALVVNRLQIDTYQDVKKHLLGVDTFALKDLTDKLNSNDYANQKFEFDEFMKLVDEYLNKFFDIVVDGNENDPYNAFYQVKDDDDLDANEDW